MEIPVSSVLALVALGLLVAVSGGVIYLTASEWRDRRRQEGDRRDSQKKRR